jgi:ABC-type branched-subunit amino acid transport system permease subunit
VIGINADYVDQALIFVVFAVSLNLLMGVAGQASMAQAGFGAVGGYVAAALSVHHGITFVPAALIGIVAGVIVGGVVSLPALRLSGEYLILLTLAVGTVIISLIETIPSLGGVQGLLGVGQVKVLGWTATSTKSFLPFLGGIALVTLAVCLRISSSGYGRVLRAIREDEVAARGIGKNTFRFKGQTFAITSGMAALAGVLIVYYNQVAAPGFFVVDESIVIITMLVLGGTGNLLGSAVGAAVVIWLDPVLRFVIHVDPATSAVLRLVIYGLVLVVVMIFRPEGLIPERGAFPWAVVWRRFVRQDVVDEAVPAAIHGSGTGAARMLGPSAVGQVSWETLGPAGVSPTAGWRPSGSGKDISEGGKEPVDAGRRRWRGRSGSRRAGPAQELWRDHCGRRGRYRATGADGDRTDWS